jgi:hypothetical protein
MIESQLSLGTVRDLPGRSGPPPDARLVRIVFVGLIALAVGCFDFSTLGDDGGSQGGGQPAQDCISAHNPAGPRPCGLNFWDRDSDTISETTEGNLANTVSSGGFYNFSVARWDTNYSQARGIALNGTLYKGMNLPNSWTGYEHYDNCDGLDVDDWGTGHLVRLIEAAGRLWVQRRASNDVQRIGVGDLSLREGGYFPGHPGVAGCVADHSYHRQGVDVDIRYARKDGVQGPLNICENRANYDTVATQTLINSVLLAQQARPADANAPIDSIFLDLDCLGIIPTSIMFHRAGHQDHFHVRIRDPDGSFN